MRESGLKFHVTLINLMTEVHCFKFQNRTLNSFSEGWLPRYEITSDASCSVDSKQQFIIIGIS